MTEAAKTAEKFCDGIQCRQAELGYALDCGHLYPLSICFDPDKEVRDQQPVNR
ncbi:hypothetical protein [Rhizobium grahamii]|uniref:hypothetical protein n=1 Tax=Rhizobium grahamii TaxID=1120045 RepID=UPI001674FB85|nr:hypothetical protein [Rhizobium grahamii]